MKKSYMNNLIKKITAAVLILVMAFGIFPANAYCKEDAEIKTLYINGDEEAQVRVIHYNYDDNLYISLRDMGKALAPMGKGFRVELGDIDGDTAMFVKPVAESEGDAEEDEDIKQAYDPDSFPGELDVTRKRIFVVINDNTYNLYVITHKDDDDEWDCYMSMGEFSLIMNMEMRYEASSLYINTANEMDLTSKLMENVYLMADSCLVGDATSNNIYYESNSDMTISLASTTKLMTYLILKDAMAAGEISENDYVTFSQKAQEEAESSNGTLPVVAGKSAPIEQVIQGMLIISSNECALALAEHLSGTEEAFVERMNNKCRELNLSDNAMFYNSNGLPKYDGDILNTKLQNHMTANDMFILASHILEKYPEITEITSIKKIKLSAFDNKEIKNTNLLLHNVPGCVGLKTGTTDKAQSCLVAAYETKDLEGKTHYVISVVYGAENAQTQSYTSMLLMRYGIQRFDASELGITPQKNDSDYVPETLEEYIGCIINSARKDG